MSADAAHGRPRKRFDHIVTPTPQECRAARAQIGWSRERLAEAAGVKKRTVIDYETGLRMPRVGTLIAIRRAFRAAGLSLPGDSPVSRNTTP